MKKVAVMLLVLVLTFSGCTFKNNATQSNLVNEDLKVIRVAANQYFLGTPISYIIDNKLDIANGLKIEISVYPSGVQENEAIANGEVDVALIGGSFVFGVVQSDAKVIAEYIHSKGGNAIYARKGESLFDVKGFNPTYPDVYGDRSSVIGKTIFLEKGTTAELLTSRWLETIGVRNEDVQLVDMDFASSFDALLKDEGDIAALVSPYSFLAGDMGYKKIASFEELSYPFYEVIVASSDAYETRKDDLATFLSLIFMANDALESSSKMKNDYVMQWYEESGNPNTKKLVKAESREKDFITSKEAKNLQMGVFEKKYATFMAQIGNLDANQVKIVEDNVKTDILEMALTKLE